MPDGTSGASSHRAHKHMKVVSEDPRTEPHVPAHAAPGNPSPITLEDMSDQEGVGFASKPEATLTHPSARDMDPSITMATGDEEYITYITVGAGSPIRALPGLLSRVLSALRIVLRITLHWL